MERRKRKLSVKEVVERWLTKDHAYERPRRGQIRQGEILKVEGYGITVDLGLKRDGFVPRADLERLDKEATSSLEPGQKVTARIVRLEDQDGNLVLSLYQARFEEDWNRAQELLESGDVWQGEVIEYNRGGLIVKFGHLRAFVPASHLARRLSSHRFEARLEAYVGQELPLKVIEVNRNRRRVILSERLARQQIREQSRERLLNELIEGQVCRGTVRRLCRFGAFVDLGGADGLIHISELAWRQVRHPRETLQVGDEIDVYVLRLDHERKRIGLSLKRLQPNPWTLVDETYTTDQLVSGTVTNVVDFGAFVLLGLGVEGLVHVSELADPPPSDPREMVKGGDELVLRILRIDSSRKRLALSLRQVSVQERDKWLAQQADGQAGETEEPIRSPSGSEEALPPLLSQVEETAQGGSEQVVGEKAVEVSPPASIRQPEDEGLWVSLLQDVESEKA
jgi:small subunit ribosomal protein S1